MPLGGDANHPYMPQADGPFDEPSRRLFVHWMALRMESILGRFHHGIFHNNRFHCEPRIDRGLLSFPSHKSGAKLHSPHRMMHTLLAKSTVSFPPGGLSHARARKVSTYKTHVKKSTRMSGHADMDGHHKHLCMLLPSNGSIKHRHPNTDTQTQTPKHRYQAQTPNRHTNKIPQTRIDTRAKIPNTYTQAKHPSAQMQSTPSNPARHEWPSPSKTSKHTRCGAPVTRRASHISHDEESHRLRVVANTAVSSKMMRLLKHQYQWQVTSSSRPSIMPSSKPERYIGMQGTIQVLYQRTERNPTVTAQSKPECKSRSPTCLVKNKTQHRDSCTVSVRGNPVLGFSHLSVTEISECWEQFRDQAPLPGARLNQ